MKYYWLLRKKQLHVSYKIIMIIDLNNFCLSCLKLIKVFKNVIFEKKKKKWKSIKSKTDAQSSKVQYIIEILMKIRKWSRENDGESVVISFIVYVIVKPYHFFMSCLECFKDHLVFNINQTWQCTKAPYVYYQRDV